MGVEIGLDLFPAKVTLPSGAELSPVKVYVADGRVLVYVVQSGVPTLYYDRELVSTTGGNVLRGIDLQVPDGIVRVVKARGCGCGNPLKRFDPWPGERRSWARM